MAVDQKKLKGVMAAPAAKRYGHFVKTVADNRELWGLYDDGWTMVAANDDSQEAVALWPAREYAEAYAAKHGGGDARSLDLDAFLNEWIPKLRHLNRIVAVFPTPEGKGIFPSLDELEANIRYELSLIE